MDIFLLGYRFRKEKYDQNLTYKTLFKIGNCHIKFELLLFIVGNSKKIKGIYKKKSLWFCKFKVIMEPHAIKKL